MFGGIFNRTDEAKQQLAAEQRAMAFNREQGIVQPSIQTDQMELINQEGKSDLIKWQQELDEDLFKLCCRLTGWKETIDEKGNKTYIKASQPLCNEFFIDNVVIPQLSPYLNKNFINSVLQEERILKMLEHTANSIADNMADNFDKYDIDFVNYDIVLQALKDFLTPAAYRSKDGFTKIRDSMIMKRIESSTESVNPANQKKGLFGMGI